MSQQLSAHLSPLLISIIVIPLTIVLLLFAVDINQDPPSLNKTTHSTFYSLPPAYKTTQKEQAIIDEFAQVSQQMTAQMERNYRNMFIFKVGFLVLELCILGYILYTYIQTYIKLTINTLQIHTCSFFKNLNTVTIPLADISTIHVQTTTPLIPIKTAIQQINWRDTIYILTSNNSATTIPLFLFPSAKKIILEVVHRNPNISITFAKNTLQDNMHNTMNK